MKLLLVALLCLLSLAYGQVPPNQLRFYDSTQSITAADGWERLGIKVAGPFVELNFKVRRTTTDTECVRLTCRGDYSGQSKCIQPGMYSSLICKKVRGTAHDEGLLDIAATATANSRFRVVVDRWNDPEVAFPYVENVVSYTMKDLVFNVNAS
eukprot:CAMPEP_0177650376 /NCGR_PEP_ID=MMETSP0447-20121125/11908_1 /TAXON_ID=0 /ORGANISM="Stygamoeba regulata, Strain BSH-02190019" /LENGTH=152 /DNA_ID=CAMNT_0019153239 /DNA_START=102 /DNA_END=560 /DNA_ORIENTATION=-